MDAVLVCISRPEQILLSLVVFVHGYFKVNENVESAFCRLFPHDSRTKLSQKPNKQGKSKNTTKTKQREIKKKKRKEKGKKKRKEK